MLTHLQNLPYTIFHWTMALSTRQGICPIDQVWFQGLNEGSPMDQLFYVVLADLGTWIGISPHHLRLCSQWNGKGVATLSWFLLYCLVQRTWYPEFKGSQRCPWSFPQTPQNISINWCSSQWLQSTLFSCSYPLSLTYLGVWHSKWALLVYNWIETHQGCERALVSIKLLEHAKANAYYKLPSWQISSCTGWLC